MKMDKVANSGNDEFYTQLSDIENELRHYRDHFKGKVVYCNCDDARESNFFKYFSMNFEFLGLKKLIATGYKKDGRGVKLVYDGDRNGNRTVDDEEVQVEELEGDGVGDTDVLAEALADSLDPHEGLVLRLEFGAVLADPAADAGCAADDQGAFAHLADYERVVHVALEVEEERRETEPFPCARVAAVPGGADLVRGRTGRDGRAAQALPALDGVAVRPLGREIHRHGAADFPRLRPGREGAAPFATAPVLLQAAVIGDEIAGPLELRRLLREPAVPDEDPALVEHVRESPLCGREEIG